MLASYKLSVESKSHALETYHHRLKFLKQSVEWPLVHSPNGVSDRIVVFWNIPVKQNNYVTDKTFVGLSTVKQSTYFLYAQWLGACLPVAPPTGVRRVLAIPTFGNRGCDCTPSFFVR